MSQPLYIAFIWHMHQPYYRDLASGRCSMPWVRLHATKDYLDMVKRLEPFPNLHQTFNLVPSLLDQLEEYLPPSQRSDDFLDLSRKPAADLSAQERRFLLQWFFMAHLERMIRPHARYHDLFAKRGPQVDEAAWVHLQKRFRTQDYLDLQVWFNLVWIDPWLRQQDPRLAALEAKGVRFTEEEKRYVLDQHLSLIASIIPAYREAMARGQIELTTSAYYHPILPLLCDSRAAHRALPALPLPETPFHYPEDAQWQLEQGITRHQQAFGQRPTGFWPPEGSVSEDVVRLALKAQSRWIATDEAILWRTLKSPRSLARLYRPHLLRRSEGSLAIVFRDRELSDLIGFVYSQWDPKTAVDDFLGRLGDIHQQFKTANQPALVSIILDGENAWEFYPNDGHEFLTGLYQALANDPRFRCVTVSEFLQQYPVEGAESLPELFSGSWIDANFATWIGHPEKNAAWGHLLRARQALDGLDANRATYPEAWRSLGAAEGSDWMWWFGDTHFSAQADEFDRLFRQHLSNSYRSAGLEVPEALQKPIRRPTTFALHPPTGPIHPTIDGRETTYYEWLYAGCVELRQQYSAIHRGQQCLRRLLYGCDERHLYLCIDPHVEELGRFSSWVMALALSDDLEVRITHEGTTTRAQLLGPHPVILPCAYDRIVELAVPRDAIPSEATGSVQLTLTLLQTGEVVERHPSQGTFELIMPTIGDLESHAWSA